MPFVNTRHADQCVSFKQAVQSGLGRGQGLFLPEFLTRIEDVPALLKQDFVSRSTRLLQHMIGKDMAQDDVAEIVSAAFDFPVPLVRVSEQTHALELFHGSSLAFKDFGARFLAHCLAHFRAQDNDQRPTTIFTATSGDTGAAVAQAFYNQPGIEVVILYPKGRITGLQEKLFCTLGGNIRTFAVEDNFDACQAMVKQAFLDPELVDRLGLNSANSINIARLLAQVCYYFEAVAQLPEGARPVFSVPSGNFGNVTAALLAVAAGLPVKRIIAATNCNDTVPRFLASGNWEPRTTIPTITNAMDISRPNNFERVLALQDKHHIDVSGLLVSEALSDEETRQAIFDLDQLGYIADPHSALGWRVLQNHQTPADTGVFLCTAHPAKFKEEVEAVLNKDLPLPPALAAVVDREVLSESISSDFNAFRPKLLARAGSSR